MPRDIAHRYLAYGLRIRSEIPLPEFLTDPALTSSPDVEIRRGSVSDRPRTLDSNGLGFSANATGVCYVLEGVGAFQILHDQVVVDAESAASDQVLRLPIIGPVLGLVLFQRGYFLLHASAVQVPTGAIAFAGGAGFGKSTLAALLHGRHHDLITDDLTAVEMNGGVPRVQPSYPQIKLWPDAVRALGDTPESLPRLHPEYDKRAFRFVNGFAQDSLPLQRLYMLGIGEEVSISSLNPQDCVEEVLGCWYGARFGKSMFRTLELRTHFLQTVQFANTVPVRLLKRPANLFQDADHAGKIEAEIFRDLGIELGGIEPGSTEPRSTDPSDTD